MIALMAYDGLKRYHENSKKYHRGEEGEEVRSRGGKRTGKQERLETVAPG